MAGDAYGAETQEEPKAQEDIRKQQAAEVAKNAKVAEALRGEIAELKAQGESDRIDFKLQLAGVRNVKVARCPGRPRRRRRRAQGGGAVAVRRHPCKATGRQDGASQCGHQHGRRQDHETHLNYLFYSCTDLASEGMTN